MKFGVAFLILLAATNTFANATTVPACFLSDTAEGIQASLELARTPAERRQGLMGRETLPKANGMLFIYPSLNDAGRGFWMKNTLIPLDIAYLDSDQRIVAIRAMEPCRKVPQANCPIYRAGVPFRFAVEMNSGFFEESGVMVGYRLLWGQDAASACDITEQVQ